MCHIILHCRLFYLTTFHLGAWGHSLTATNVAPGLVEVTMFGGCTTYNPEQPDDQQTMLADTVLLNLGNNI